MPPVCQSWGGGREGAEPPMQFSVPVYFKALTYKLEYSIVFSSLHVIVLQYYYSGVFSSAHCSSTYLSHSMLLTGYGTYQGTKYWLVKNR